MFSNKRRGVIIVIIVGIVVAARLSGNHNGSGTSRAASSTSASSLKVSRCEAGGKTVLTGIPVDATDFRFRFIGGGFTGHSWHTDWLPNDSQVKGGTYWIYTLGDGDTTASGVTGEVEMSDGSTVETDLQACY